jgi:hypothetical protein
MVCQANDYDIDCRPDHECTQPDSKSPEEARNRLSLDLRDSDNTECHIETDDGAKADQRNAIPPRRQRLIDQQQDDREQ